MSTLIIGLGNQGEEYKKTRHNAGADSVRLLAKRAELEFETKPKLFAEVAQGKISSKVVSRKSSVIVALPSIYMNTSGKAVAAVAKFFKIKPKDIVVAHDDMDIPIGDIKIVFGRGSGGHKGVESVFRALKTKEFVRIRIGTMTSSRSQKPGQRELENIVVKKMTPAEAQALAKGIRKTADALAMLAYEGLEKAMNEFN